MINVLSCFDGISAGRLALQRAGIEVGTYYRSEVDKYADKVAMHHFPNDVQLGDVTKWREWDLDWSSIDMLIGGSPCQGFSFAGKQAGTKAVLNGEDVLVTDRETYLEMKEKGAEFLSQSYLFWEYVLILDHIRSYNPEVKFLLENVKMKKELLEMIDDAMGVKSVVINSSLLSAQNRVRHYWANWEITQPEDKGILLKDVLEDISTSINSSVVYRPCERIKEGNAGHIANATDIKGMDCIKHVYGGDGKAPTLTTMGGGHREPRVFVNESATKSGKSYTLTASYGGAVAWNSCERKQRTMVPVCESESVEPNVYNGLLYRKLTPTECARLQTFPDGWAESVVSNSQSYKAYGNSWTVDVIAHIFKCM